MHDQSSLVVYAFSIPLSSSSLPRQFSSESSIDFSTSILYGGFGSGSGGCDRKRLSSSYFSPTSLHGGAISTATDNNNASPSTASTITKLQSTISLILLDRIFKRILQYMNIAFPSSLAGCRFILSFFLLAKTGSGGGGVGPVLYQFLAPGAAILARWLPVFFCTEFGDASTFRWTRFVYRGSQGCHRHHRWVPVLSSLHFRGRYRDTEYFQ